MGNAMCASAVHVTRPPLPPLHLSRRTPWRLNGACLSYARLLLSPVVLVCTGAGITPAVSIIERYDNVDRRELG